MEDFISVSMVFSLKKKLIGDTIYIYLKKTITELYFKVASAFTTKY